MNIKDCVNYLIWTDYVTEIYQTPITISRAEPKLVQEEFKQEVPDPDIAFWLRRKIRERQSTNTSRKKKWKQ